MPDGSSLILTEVDRLALERLADGMAERAALRASRSTERAEKPEDTKRARLERNQERLEHLLDDAIALPALARAIEESGHAVGTLREAALRGTWARDVAPAVRAVQPVVERETSRQRQEATAEATRAMIEIGIDGGEGRAVAWLDALDGRVRASLGQKEPDTREVALRLVVWAEEALSAVPEPVATATRAAIARHAFAAELDGEGEGPAAERRAALRDALSADESGRYQPVARSAAPDDKGEPNRVSAADGQESGPAARQIGDLAGPADPEESAEAAPGLFARLRSLVVGRNAMADMSATSDTSDMDNLPEALKKRYAVHVSADRKTIELFEAGGKVPAITLDAKSITTPHNEGAVVTDVVALARDRGWQTLKVAGTAEFKDAVWLEASKAGLIAQHDPSSATRAAYAKWDSERPANQIQQGRPAPAILPDAVRRPQEDLARAFAEKSAEERLADPRLRNAQLELVIGIRTAERELKRPIAEMPDVAQALTAAVREQLAHGKVFDAPFVKPSPPKAAARQITNPKIDADRIPPPRP